MIKTIESDYEYRMQCMMREMLERYNELQDLSAEELQEELFKKEYALEFAKLVLQDMCDWAGEELFTKELYY